jgi:diaminopimelate epimerase
VAKYVFDHDLCRKTNLTIETGAGVLRLELDVSDGRVRRVRVDMGEPVLQAERIPTSLPGSPVVNAKLPIADRVLQVTCVSMGNPHCVTFVDKLDDQWVLQIGPRVEIDAHFPNRVNVEFVEVLSTKEVRMRVWERGSGETLACGTGACAVCVAGVLTGRTGHEIQVHLPGGDLELQWAADNHVYLTGPAVEVFSGQY